MDNHAPKSEIDRSRRLRFPLWQFLEQHTDSAFTLAGISLLASLVVPIGIRTVVDWPWLVGVVLVGLGVVAVAFGLLGLYSRPNDRFPRLAAAGAGSATISGTAGVFLLALSGLTAGSMVISSFEFSVGMRTFAVIAFAMAGGYAFGSLSFGIAGRRGAGLSGRTSQLLVGGGTLLLVPAVGGLLQFSFGIDQPPWIFFPFLGLVAIDTVAVGITLRSGSDPLAGAIE